MFTGIVASRARIVSFGGLPGGAALVVAPCPGAEKPGVGDSIAIDGCCLTVAELRDDGILFELSEETLGRTIAGGYRSGAQVNVECALRAGDRLGGHLVTGHVDLVGTAILRRRAGDFATLEVELPAAAPGLVAEKGSVAVNGVSLTVASWNRTEPGGTLTAALIPETISRTNLGDMNEKTRVNIEFDLLARHVVEALKKRE